MKEVKFNVHDSITCTYGVGEVMESCPSSETDGTQYRVRVDFTDHWVEEDDLDRLTLDELVNGGGVDDNDDVPEPPNTVKSEIADSEGFVDGTDESTDAQEASTAINEDVGEGEVDANMSMSEDKPAAPVAPVAPVAPKIKGKK